MRMWMVPVEILCRKHLLGEHVELHMLVGSIKKGKNLYGYIEKRLIFPMYIEERHDEIIQELERRSYTHNSPILTQAINISQSYFIEFNKDDLKNNLFDLVTRCEECKARYFQWRDRLLQQQMNMRK